MIQMGFTDPPWGGGRRRLDKLLLIYRKTLMGQAVVCLDCVLRSNSTIGNCGTGTVVSHLLEVSYLMLL